MAVMSEYSIPELSPERLQELVKRIRPIVRFDDKPCFIKPVDPSKVAYTWSPKKFKSIPASIEVFRTIRTLHTYGYYGMFKPSIAEVLAQIPLEDLNAVVAFEIVKSPETATDLNLEREALNAGFHVAETALYRNKVKPRTAWERVKERIL